MDSIGLITLTWLPCVPTGHEKVIQTPGPVSEVDPQSKHDWSNVQTSTRVPFACQPVNKTFFKFGYWKLWLEEIWTYQILLVTAIWDTRVVISCYYGTTSLVGDWLLHFDEIVDERNTFWAAYREFKAAYRYIWWPVFQCLSFRCQPKVLEDILVCSCHEPYSHLHYNNLGFWGAHH